jgi:putative MATE family efflux protein
MESKAKGVMKTGLYTGNKGASSLELIAHGPIASTIIRLALPMMIAMLVQLIYNLTDTFFIGQTGNPDMLAGVLVTFPLFILAQGIGNIFGVGTSNYISRKLGENNFGEAKRANAVSFYTNIITGILIMVIILVFKTPLLHLIGTSSVTFQYADDYFTIINFFLPFSMLNIALAAQIRSEGAAHKAMIGMVLGIALNIILDPLFILVLNWGVKGAAWATVISTIISVAYFIVHFFSRKTFLSIGIRQCKPNKRMYQEIFKIGIPASLANVIMSIAMTLNNIIASEYGDHVVAASGINLRIVSVCYTMIMALAMGLQPFAGYNYGAKNYKRLCGGIAVTFFYTTVFAFLSVGVVIVFGKNLFALFIDDETIIQTGVKIMRAFIWGIPFLGFPMTLIIAFQAFGRSKEASIVTLGRQCFFYIPSIYLLNYLWGFEGYIYAQSIADIVTAIIALILALPLLKEIGFLKQGIVSR